MTNQTNKQAKSPLMIGTVLAVVSLLIWIYLANGVEKQTSVLTDVINVGLLPDQGAQDIRDRHRDLLDYLTSKTGYKFNIVLSNSYEEMVDAFGKGEVHLAFFGGLTFLLAENRHNAIPIVLRDVDLRFVSTFFARTDMPGNSIVAWQNQRLAFGSNLSTSGHVMPRHFLRENFGILPETFFSEIIYSGSHDATVTMVANGDADIGVANAQVVERFLIEGQLAPDKLKIIWTSPPYADYVWAVTPTIDETMRTSLLNAFLGLGGTDGEYGHILNNLGAGSFLPAASGDFNELRETATLLGMLEGEQ